MPGCLIFVLGLLLPRVTMVFIFLLTDWFSRAFDTWVWPVLGFFVMPYTTLAWMAGELHGGVRGWWMVLVIVAVLVDADHWHKSGQHYQRRQKARQAE